MDKSTSKAPAAEKAKNYSAEQEAAIIAASPLDLESAKALAATMGKSYRSVIAKAKSLGLAYTSKPAPAKRVTPVTKSELVKRLEIATDVDADSFSGLEKATTAALVALLGYFDVTAD